MSDIQIRLCFLNYILLSIHCEKIANENQSLDVKLFIINKIVENTCAKRYMLAVVTSAERGTVVEEGLLLDSICSLYPNIHSLV
ncbi:hypothetical protein BH23THE1_BH23THE1_07390 [soil metagenome]